MLNVIVIEPEPKLAPILAHAPQIHLARAAADIHTLDANALPCELVLISAQFPRAQVTQWIEQLAPARRVVIVSDSETRADLVSFFEAGAVGYVPQDADVSEIVSMLTAIHQGKTPLPPEIGTALVKRMHELLALEKTHGDEPRLLDANGLETLTPREREILALIRNGASNQLIANELTIEVGTVKNHVHKILKKLNVSRREEAALYWDIQKTPPT